MPDQQTKKKKKPYYDSVDVVSYAVLVFVIGVAVGVAVGRFKHARFYFCEKRLDFLDQYTQKFSTENLRIRSILNTQYKPIVVTLRGREPSYGCTKIAGNYNWSKLDKPFQTMPDVLMNMGGLFMSLEDSSNTKWIASTQVIPRNASLEVTSITPADKNINACWIAHPTKDIE